ncbi:MAG: iron-sulfur cluster assembly accessory protein [Anaerolineae bacterium]|nr:iron-sulfur cluster assembly accessory protein [Anaerolineae bacterium]
MAIVEKHDHIEQITLIISPAALEAVKQLLYERNVPDYALRIIASNVGYLGVQFSLALEAEAQPTDRVLEVEGVRILLDSASLTHLNGVRMDYVENLAGKGFQITQSRASSGCGCGASSQTATHDNGIKASGCCN